MFGSNKLPTSMSDLIALFNKVAAAIKSKQEAEVAAQQKIIDEAKAAQAAAQAEVDAASLFAENMTALTEKKVVTE